ncbi:hypothetical protein BH18ACT4_BH18ACT4_09350 [soil metagenome]
MNAQERDPLTEPHESWALEAARAAAAKHGHDTVVLDVGDVIAITDHFVITSGGNTRLVRGIVEEVEKRIVEAGGPGPTRIEGRDDLRWVLMDYGDFVVHVFLQEARDYYELERLWSDVARVTWDDSSAREAAVAGE